MMSLSLTTDVVIIDNGTAMTKVGLEGGNYPDAVFPSIVARTKNNEYVGVGDGALCKYGLIENPIKRGVVSNWDDMEYIWGHTFVNELRVNFEEHPVLLTEPPSNPEANRKKMTEIMFETFGVPAMEIENTAVLSLFAQGFHRFTGVVVECGDGASDICPVSDGWPIKEGMSSIDLAGGDLTDFMKSLTERKYSFTSSAAEREIVRDMKEKMCYVAFDYEKELKKARNSSSSVQKYYQLPDGTVITVADECFICPEALFQPSLIKSGKHDGIHEAIFNCIQKCDIYCKEDLYDNILLSGGTTLLPGIADRLRKEMIALAPRSLRIEVAGIHSAWNGASLMVSMSNLSNSGNLLQWMSKEEYYESGKYRR